MAQTPKEYKMLLSLYALREVTVPKHSTSRGVSVEEK